MTVYRWTLLLAIGAFSKTAAGADRFPETLPNTRPLTIKQPLDEVMVSGISKFAERELAASVKRRAKMWNRDYSSRAAYEKSVAGNRRRLETIIGAVDKRHPAPELVFPLKWGPVPDLAGSPTVRIDNVVWKVLDGVTAEGVFLYPKEGKSKKPIGKAWIIAIPDADWTPEMFAGMRPGVAPHSQIARRLAENGCMVVVPTLINRDDTFSGNPLARYTNQPHREFVYRMAFEMGRHIIGYEVQKVRAAVDACQRLNKRFNVDLPIGVVGVGEGGLLALYSAAVDPRIDAVMVSGYFQPREQLWKEPIYRNVWSLLSEFGDANIASLVAPRSLVIEASAAPTVDGPPKPRSGRSGAAPGRIATPALKSVKAEFARAKTHYDKLAAGRRIALVASAAGNGPPGSEPALSAFLQQLGFRQKLKPLGEPPTLRGKLNLADAGKRQKRQLDELVEFTQTLLRQSAKVRDRFWSKAKRTSLAEWQKTSASYRDHVYDEMIGRLPEPTMPPNVRTRKVLDKPKYTGYEVVIDVYPNVIASGILLLPKDLKPGEKRPVVVCQHGLEGVPMDTITTTGRGYRYYKAFAAKLAERGFITYAPQNPYRGRDKFRVIQRKSNPLKRSLFSYIIPQHQRTLDWLATLPNVDADRIGFYGLSYGGKTAVRVPPMLVPGAASRTLKGSGTRQRGKSSPGRVGYCLSICSADFNEWVKKNTSNEDRYSYIFTGEYEIFEWNMGHVANYAELSNLMAPRPFMVERGHDDGVAPDEWVAWEFAKVRRHYVKLGLADKVEIEFFNGPHSINGKGTFDFLHRHLRWPERDE